MASAVDPDIFAVLLPLPGPKQHNTSTAFAQPYNAARYYGDDEIMATTASLYQKNAAGAPYSAADYADDCFLLLSFSDEFKDLSKGIRFGRSTVTSDVLLQGHTNSRISLDHFALRVTEDGTFLVEDLSSCGTTVVYSGYEDPKPRAKGHVVAMAPGKEAPWSEVNIVAGSIAFQFVFPNQRTAKEEYMVKLKDFIQKSGNLDVDFAQAEKERMPPTSLKGQLRTYVFLERLRGRDAVPIYRARCDMDQSLVAAKKVPLQLAGEDETAGEARTAALREIKLIKRYSHPNIVPILDIKEAADVLYIVLPFYTLGHIGNLDSTSRVQPEDLCGEVLKGLDWLHSQGIVHGNLKQENILIRCEKPFQACIADLGMSTVLKHAGLETQRDLRFVAPENYHDNGPKHEPPADIWAIAIITYLFQQGAPRLSTVDRDEDPIGWIEEWHEALRSDLEVGLGEAALHNCEEMDDHLLMLVAQMLELEPGHRPSATDCLSDRCFVTHNPNVQDRTPIGADEDEDEDDDEEEYDDFEESYEY